MENETPRVFIIEINWPMEGWRRSRGFPNFYTESEADQILAMHPPLCGDTGSFDYRKREIDYV